MADAVNGRDLHTQWDITSKAGTLNIERNHLNFRTRIKRLQRRTICYSKSAEMHEAVIKLYVHYSNSS
jgi:insertion element IS1 protein InsB